MTNDYAPNADTFDVELSIVVPFYNPGPGIRPTIENLVDALQRTGQSFEIIAVSDGSTDPSPESIGDLPVAIVKLDRNHGKGQALRVGMGLSKGRYIGFIDADGDISPSFMADFANTAAKDRPDAVLGSKCHPRSRVSVSRPRRILSLAWQTAVRLLFQLPVGDSQAGIKLFSRNLISAVLPETSMQGFAFDLELLVIAYDLGYRKFIETPIEVSDRYTSTISFPSAARMLRDLLMLFWRLRLRPALFRR